jgi:hypothetical protein
MLESPLDPVTDFCAASGSTVTTEALVHRL